MTFQVKSLLIEPYFEAPGDLDNPRKLMNRMRTVDVATISTLTGKDPSVQRAYEDPDAVVITRAQLQAVTSAKSLVVALNAKRAEFVKQRDKVIALIAAIDAQIAAES